LPLIKVPTLVYAVIKCGVNLYATKRCSKKILHFVDKEWKKKVATQQLLTVIKVYEQKNGFV